MTDNWQKDFNWRSAIGLIVFLAIVLSMVTGALRGDSKELDGIQTVDITVNKQDIKANERRLDAVELKQASYEKDTEYIKQMLTEIRSDIKEIKDKK